MLKKELEKSQNECEQMKNAVKASESVEAELKKVFEEERDLARLKAQNEIAKKEEEIEELRRGVSDVEKQLELKRSESERLNSEVNAAKDKMSGLEDEKLKMKGLLDETNDKFKNLEENSEKWRTELMDARTELTKMKRSTQKQLFQQHADLEKNKSEFTKLYEELEKMKAALEEANAKYKELKEQTKTNIIKQGWLTKQGGVVRSWKSRYFTLLNTGELKYYGQPLPDPKGVIYMYNVANVTTSPTKGKTKWTLVVQIYGSEREYILSCKDQEEMDDWFKVMRSASDNLAENKRKLGSSPNSRTGSGD